MRKPATKTTIAPRAKNSPESADICSFGCLFAGFNGRHPGNGQFVIERQYNDLAEQTHGWLYGDLTSGVAGLPVHRAQIA